MKDRMHANGHDLTGVATVAEQSVPEFGTTFAAEPIQSSAPNLEQAPTLRAFEGGATRSTDWDGTAFHLIPIEGLEYEGAAMERGLASHGIDNWRGGIPLSELLRHAWGHLAAFTSGQLRGESDLRNHIGAVRANLSMIAHFLETRPDLIDVPVIQRALEREK